LLLPIAIWPVPPVDTAGLVARASSNSLPATLAAIVIVHKTPKQDARSARKNLVDILHLL
jgi:hypothetical protein